MLPETLRQEQTHQFMQAYHEQVVSLGLATHDVTELSDNFYALKQHTIQNFGFEWIEYGRFGWESHSLASVTIEDEERTFRNKSLLTQEDVDGKLTLDAGCGNGRYSYWAAQYGAQVIGVDLGDGVEAASQNTANLPNVQIVQGDIFQLPFAPNCFDVVFSIGVLMHTGDARQATFSLARKLKPGGSLTVHVYGKGRHQNIIHRLLDEKLRNHTTQLPVDKLQELTRKATYLRLALQRLHLIDIVSQFIFIGSTSTQFFDWYAAPVATLHTYKEVFGWFQELQMEIIDSNKGHRQRVLAPTSSWKRTQIGSPQIVNSASAHRTSIQYITLVPKLIRNISKRYQRWRRFVLPGSVTVRGVAKK
jgi:2-polyprenyl-3-methyl-5-hydroxy-6-metoxy-1,4-benzoquinol methylase